MTLTSSIAYMKKRTKKWRCKMCGYDPFWIYDAILEQEYLERMEEEEEEEQEESEVDSGD